MTQTRPLRLFISYAHKDDPFRRQLETHLSPLKRQNLIEIWSDRAIEAGQEWEQSIHDRLKAAEIILLLISPDFLASEYIYNRELKRAMERHETGQARVIPVLLRPCDWKDEVFGKLQGVPDDAKPISRWEDRDEAFHAAAKAIRRAAEVLMEDRARRAAEEHAQQEAEREAGECDPQEKKGRAWQEQEQSERREAEEQARQDAEVQAKSILKEPVSSGNVESGNGLSTRQKPPPRWRRQRSAMVAALLFLFISSAVGLVLTQSPNQVTPTINVPVVPPAPTPTAEQNKWNEAAHANTAEAYRNYIGAFPQDAHAAEAQFNLGLMYATGRGVPQDDAEAVRWYRKAAEQGNTYAKNNLGMMYANGRGVAKNDAQAVEWYRKAAEQGNAYAQTNLGRMYEQGRGVAKDNDQAVQWYRKAAEQGNADARHNLKLMCERGVRQACS